MKSVVVYYSMTGNTKKIAEEIQAGIMERSGQCDIVRLKDFSPKKMAEYDLVGIGSPVINQKEPPNVTEFLHELKTSNEAKHVFVFCTHGATPCRYLANMVATLSKKGMTVIGWADWFGSAFYPAVPKPYLTDGHPDAVDMEEARTFGREMADRHQRIHSGETHFVRKFPQGKEYDELYEPMEVKPWRFPEVMAYGKLMRNHAPQINKEKCLSPKCSHCIDNCPAKNISSSESGPVFGEKCAYCYLCEQTCPRGAIEVDWKPLEEAHYELVRGWLKKSTDAFESRGRFRRLIQYKDLGWDTPVWKTKAPRFKIP